MGTTNHARENEHQKHWHFGCNCFLVGFKLVLLYYIGGGMEYLCILYTVLPVVAPVILCVNHLEKRTRTTIKKAAMSVGYLYFNVFHAVQP
jgi:hypothetical protein